MLNVYFFTYQRFLILHFLFRELKLGLCVLWVTEHCIQSCYFVEWCHLEESCKNSSGDLDGVMCSYSVHINQYCTDSFKSCLSWYFNSGWVIVQLLLHKNVLQYDVAWYWYPACFNEMIYTYYPAERCHSRWQQRWVELTTIHTFKMLLNFWSALQ